MLQSKFCPSITPMMKVMGMSQRARKGKNGDEGEDNTIRNSLFAFFAMWIRWSVVEKHLRMQAG